MCWLLYTNFENKTQYRQAAFCEIAKKASISMFQNVYMGWKLFLILIGSGGG